MSPARKRAVAKVAPPKLPAGDELEERTNVELEDELVLRDVLARDLGPVAASVEHIEIRGSRIVAARLTGAEIDVIHLSDVVFEDSELSGVVLNAASMSRVTFERCRMSGFVAPLLKAEDVRFVDCRLNDASLRITRLTRCAFEGCDLSGADLYDSTLTDCRIIDSDLRRADLSQVRLERVRLHGSRLEDLRGADALRGATIGSDQVLSLAYPLLAAMQITVDDATDT